MIESVPGKHLIDFEGAELQWDNETITVLELRDLAGVEHDVILIEIDRENNERHLHRHDETLHLKHGHRYGKHHPYKRGSDRMQEEVELLRKNFPHLEVREVNGTGSFWFLIAGFDIMVDGWSKRTIDMAFEATRGYPAAAPYGFYVRDGIRFNGATMPQSYTEFVTIPFEGNWGKFSWQVEGQWKPGASVNSGNNLAGFAETLQKRFKEGA